VPLVSLFISNIVHENLMYSFYIPSYSCLSEDDDLSLNHVKEIMHADNLWFDINRVHSLVNEYDVGNVF